MSLAKEPVVVSAQRQPAWCPTGTRPLSLGLSKEALTKDTAMSVLV